MRIDAPNTMGKTATHVNLSSPLNKGLFFTTVCVDDAFAGLFRIPVKYRSHIPYVAIDLCLNFCESL